MMAFALVVLILVNNLMRSRQGRRFRAIKDDPTASSVMGVSARSTKMFAFCCSALLGGVGGCIYACYNSYINPTTFTQDLQVNYLAFNALGGGPLPQAALEQCDMIWGGLFGAVEKYNR